LDSTCKEISERLILQEVYFWEAEVDSSINILKDGGVSEETAVQAVDNWLK